MTPRVTVLLPVYNGDKYLRQAIESILGQTFTDFEFLIINDGSTDDSLAVINSYSDGRIRLISQRNHGLSATLNLGLSLARGEYIARMDSDDISLPERLDKQVAFMDKYPEIGICGTGVIMINNRGDRLRKASYPLKHEDIEVELLFNSVFAHPSVMFRRSVFTDNNLHYYSDKGEDYELWTRAVKITRLANLKEFLINYRLGAGISSNLCKDDYDRCFWQIIRQQLSVLPAKIFEVEIITHRQMADHGYVPDRQFLKKMFNWLSKLRRVNEQAGFYGQSVFDRVLARQWFAVCQRVSKKTLLSWPEFWGYTATIFWRLAFLDKLRLVKKILSRV